MNRHLRLSYVAVLVTLLCVTAGCATPVYQRRLAIPPHTLIVCDHATLMANYPLKVPEGHTLRGFCDMANRIIYVEKAPDGGPRTDYYWHEVRHLIEGRYHE